MKLFVKSVYFIVLFIKIFVTNEKVMLKMITIKTMLIEILLNK